MDKYDVICPCCGHENRSLFLRETDGWLECDACLTVMQVSVPESGPVRIEVPVRRVA